MTDIDSRKNELERAVAAELRSRAEAFSSAPDFAELEGRREMLSVPQPRRLDRRRLAFASVAAVLALGGIGVGRFLANDSTSETDAGASTEMAPPPDEVQHYVWPMALPEGWEILETALGRAHKAPEESGVVAAFGPHDRSVLVAARPKSEPIDERGVEVIVKDGVDYFLVEEYENLLVLLWLQGDFTFTLEATGLSVEETVDIAASAVAGNDSPGGAVTSLDVTLPGDFEVLVDEQPLEWSPAQPVEFRLSCPQIDPDHECVVMLSFMVPVLGSPDFMAATFWANRPGRALQTSNGEILLGEGPNPSAMSVLDNGLVLVVGPDFGPLETEGGPPASSVRATSPPMLTADDIALIIEGLQWLDATNYQQWLDTLD